MKLQDLRELSTDELKLKLKETQEVLFRYRFQTVMGQLDNPMKIKNSRRLIAQIKTLLNQKHAQE